ncbi:MAG: hypothetical protein QMC67_12290 [Candidatus Wallbacteria bacterium]
MLNQILSDYNGKFIYALDDPYIHLSIAKNFADYGIWGIGQNFASASSSLLFPLMLALIYKVTGYLEYVPFCLNIIFALLIVFTMFNAFQKKGHSDGYTFLAIVMVLFFTPVLPLIFSGMEHVIQIFLFLALLMKLADYLAFYNSENQCAASKKEDTAEPVNFLWILTLTSLLAMIRFEGLFMAAAISVVLVYLKQISRAVFVILGSALPIIFFGLISKYNDSFFLPNSILIKGNFPNVANIGDFFYYSFSFLFKLYANPHLIVLFVLLVMTLILLFNVENSSNSNKNEKILILVYLSSLIMHLQFCQVGWFYRYEAYLAASGAFLFFYLWKDFFDYKDIKVLILKITLFAMIFFPLFFRGHGSFLSILPAVGNIYQQQYQMGLFLNKYYKNHAVALNDVGAANFFANIKCVDLFGLANNDIAAAKLDKKFTTGIIREVCKKNNVKVAILYENWFGDKFEIPPEWNKVAEWGINNLTVAGGDTVSFFAPDKEDAKKLYENLKEFSSALPPEVMQKGIK